MVSFQTRLSSPDFVTGDEIRRGLIWYRETLMVLACDWGGVVFDVQIGSPSNLFTCIILTIRSYVYYLQ